MRDAIRSHRQTLVACLLLCAVAAPTLDAQSARATIDSATAARSAFRDATRAAGPAAALPFLVRAARAWPSQPLYWFNVARYAARASDTALVREAVDALAGLGAGARLAQDTSVARYSRVPALSASFARLAQNSEIRTNGRVTATLADSTVFAEGMDAHPTNGALYVGSIRHRTILEVNTNGTVRDLHLERHARIGAARQQHLGLAGTNQRRRVTDRVGRARAAA